MKIKQLMAIGLSALMVTASAAPQTALAETLEEVTEASEMPEAVTEAETETETAGNETEDAETETAGTEELETEETETSGTEELETDETETSGTETAETENTEAAAETEIDETEDTELDTEIMTYGAGGLSVNVVSDYGADGTDKKADQIAVNSICPWNSDMYGVDMSIPEGQLYYDSLMELYASWGVDFIKVDDIAYSTIYRDSHRKEIEGIRKAIDKTGREIVLSLSPGPARLQDGSFLQKNANMWRLTDDFWDEWELLYDMFDRCNYWSPFIRKGNWPDCDMLPLGHIGIRSGERGKADRMTCFTKPEQKTMITLWSIFQSPLMYGGELADLDAWTLSLLTNTEVNEMHRTLEGQRQEYRDDEWIVWSGENKESTYIAIFNVSDEKKEIPGKLTERYLRKDAKEIWSGKKVTEGTEGTEEVESHGCVLYQMKRI